MYTKGKEGNLQGIYNTICDKKKRHKNVPVEAGVGVDVIRIYCSADPQPKEIFTAPQYD
jgi:hypothetical protein